MTSQQLTASISSSSDPAITQLLRIGANADGKFTLSSYLQPPYDIRVSSPHFLTVKATNLDITSSINLALANGDANGDGLVNLFDYVVLDTHFNSGDPLADLDGDGSVNLFDYVVVDKNFGAKGD